MRPKDHARKLSQGDLYRARLESQLNPRHPLYVLAKRIDWDRFVAAFGPLYDDKLGRPAVPTRVMVGLHFIKHAYDESDESVVEKFLENPYWQFFCGCEYFEHRLPIDPSTMTRWRNRVGPEGLEQLLQETIATAQREGLLKRVDVERVNVDTTVQEKAIAYPTDARLYQKARHRLVQEAKHRGIELRQSCEKLAKRAFIKHSRYAHARQFRRARRETKRLRTYLGRVIRDIERKCPVQDEKLANTLALARRIHEQKRDDKGKLYSLWAPEVACIAKGKAHKKYEFGCKVGVVSTSKKSWVVGIQAFTGNPYDGHTLKQSLSQVKSLTGWTPRHAFTDLGYRGATHDVPGTKVHLHCQRSNSRSLRRWMRRRSAVEPVIGHLKSDNGMHRNHLHGTAGDAMNALLCGAGFNLRKLLRALGRAGLRRACFLLAWVLSWIASRDTTADPLAPRQRISLLPAA